MVISNEIRCICMPRYLIYYGYLGTRFRGVQRETFPKRMHRDTSTAKFIEDGLLSLKNEWLCDRPPSISASSRTDTGVHALSNSAHFNLCLPRDIRVYRNLVLSDTEFITSKLNGYFDKNLLELRIHKTLRVPSTFNSRFDASGRTYLYRFAIHEDNVVKDSSIPLMEHDRLYVVPSPFDVDRAEEACSLLIGSKDFGPFTKKSIYEKKAKTTRRTLSEFSLKPGRSLINPSYDPLYEKLTFFNIVVKGKAFLYHQVRRMVSVVVSIGKGEILMETLKHMLDNPHLPNKCHPIYGSVPACGLYLVGVDYPPEAFLENEDVHICMKQFLNYPEQCGKCDT